jgi:hypothetical protein
MSVPSPLTKFHTSTIVDPRQIPTEFRKSIQVHSIVVRLKLPSVVVLMYRVSFMPFSILVNIYLYT